MLTPQAPFARSLRSQEHKCSITHSQEHEYSITRVHKNINIQSLRVHKNINVRSFSI